MEPLMDEINGFARRCALGSKLEWARKM